MKYFLSMVLIGCTSKLTIDNNLNGLCDIFDEHACLEIVAKQIVLKM
jgi:hypothetical protein